jgi:hypothetical protein
MNRNSRTAEAGSSAQERGTALGGRRCRQEGDCPAPDAVAEAGPLRKCWRFLIASTLHQGMLLARSRVETASCCCGDDRRETARGALEQSGGGVPHHRTVGRALARAQTVELDRNARWLAISRWPRYDLGTQHRQAAEALERTVALIPRRSRGARWALHALKPVTVRAPGRPLPGGGARSQNADLSNLGGLLVKHGPASAASPREGRGVDERFTAALHYGVALTRPAICRKGCAGCVARRPSNAPDTAARWPMRQPWPAKGRGARRGAARSNSRRQIRRIAIVCKLERGGDALARAGRIEFRRLMDVSTLKAPAPRKKRKGSI